jgi:hypothetical protein
MGTFWKKKKVKIVKLQKFESLGKYIVQIKILEVELKMTPKFERVKYSFP